MRANKKIDALSEIRTLQGEVRGLQNALREKDGLILKLYENVARKKQKHVAKKLCNRNRKAQRVG